MGAFASTGGAGITGGSSSSGGLGSTGGAFPSGGAGFTGGAGTGGAATGGAGAGGAGTGGASTGGTAATTPVGRHGQLQVVGNQLRDASNNAVALRGQGFGWDNYWPQYYNADVVAWLRDDWCVDTVRPAMGIEPDGAYLSNPSASQARMQAVVDAAIAEELCVIIDWHAHDLHQSEAVAFFADMAQTYGIHPNVIYEVFNEPEGETWPQVKAYAEAVIATIRQWFDFMDTNHISWIDYSVSDKAGETISVLEPRSSNLGPRRRGAGTPRS